MIFNNHDGTKTAIMRGGSGYLDMNGNMHDSTEIKNLFDYSDIELTDMGVMITFLSDELIDFYECNGSLPVYLKKIKQF